MIDHAGFEVRDFARSKEFYKKTLEALGYALLVEMPEYKVAGYGDTRPYFWVSQGEPKAGADEVHLCFKAKTRADVRAFYEAALKAGGTDNGAPGLRPIYHENYYGAFVLDPDGYGIEACCHHPE